MADDLDDQPAPPASPARVRPTARWAAGWRALIARPLRGQAAVVAAFLARWVLRIGLPVLGAAAMLRALPYRAVVADVPFTVQGSLLGRPGISADTTVGNWEFPELSGLPIGVHVTPQNVDLLQLTRAVQGDRAGYVAQLQADFTAQVPRIVAWLVAETLLGILLGLSAAALVNMSMRYLRGLGPRPHELRHRARQLGVAAVVTLLVAGFGALTYNPDWVRQSRLTGTLAAAQLFPDQLSAYYEGSSKAFDVLGSVVDIQATLQDEIAEDGRPPTAFRIMTVSDVHLAAVYPLIARYAEAYDVSLILNTGDEAAFGTRAELTPSYLDAVRAVTARTPMLWVAGNHDSPEVQAVMDSVPGVTVLGDKRRTADGYAVSATVVQAYGLTIAGLPDPRVYGGPGAYGADDPAVTDPLQEEAVAQALAEAAEAWEDAEAAEDVGDGGTAGGSTAPGSTAGTSTPEGSTPGSSTPGAASTGTGQDARPVYDVVATHEPVAAAALREALDGRVRQTVSGHVHAQNDPSELQDDDGGIDLVEGSTGAGGLVDIVRGDERPPIEFSIESVGAGCEFTSIQRFEIRATVVPATADAASYGDDVTTSTVYFRPQTLPDDRRCATSLGISAPTPLVEPR